MFEESGVEEVAAWEICTKMAAADWALQTEQIREVAT